MSHSKDTLIKSTLFLACMLGSSASTMVPNRAPQNHGQFIALHNIMDAIPKPDGYKCRGIELCNGNIAIRFCNVEKPEEIVTRNVNLSELDPKKLRNTLARNVVPTNQSNTRQPLSDITNIQDSEEQIAIEVLASLEEMARLAKQQKH